MQATTLEIAPKESAAATVGRETAKVAAGASLRIKASAQHELADEP